MSEHRDGEGVGLQELSRLSYTRKYISLTPGFRQRLGFICLLQEVNRELKRIYMDGCRYNERLNTETRGSKTSPIHWFARKHTRIVVYY